MKIETFIKKHSWYYTNSDITDEHFPASKEKVSIEGATLLPLDKYYSNGDEVMKMLKEKGLRPATIHELIEYIDAHWDDIKGSGKWYPALGSVWKDAGGYRRVPDVLAFSFGDFHFNLGYFGNDWGDDDVVLVFSDSHLEPQATRKESLSELRDLAKRVNKLEEIIKHHNLGV